MSVYRITNRITQETVEIEAASFHEACHKADWMPGDCYVQKVTIPQGDPRQETK